MCHEATTESTGGTYLQGHLHVTYDELVAEFGEPTHVDDGKTQVEWAMKFEDGVVATIYDWKTYDMPATTHWHVGGFTKDAHFHVVKALAPLQVS